MKRLFTLCILLFSIGCYADGRCSLEVGANAVTLHSFGPVSLAEIGETYIWFSTDVGDIVPVDPDGKSSSTFNYNSLYRVSDKKDGIWYFRFSGEWFDEANTHRSAFYSVQWADGKWPMAPGLYAIDAVRSDRPQTSGKTFSTVGDSMTWLGQGEDFRCMLARSLPSYKFIGSYTDSFGYGHDGHGGDSSGEVLARIGQVPPSDAYFVLTGSNDGGYTPTGTAENISKISTDLLAKRRGSHVYVSTLPVRGDQYANLVPKRNAAIRSWYRHCGCHANVTLIDLNAAMQRTPHALARLIMPDHIHPSFDGYRLITSLIAAKVNGQPTAVAHAVNAIVPPVAQR